MKTTTKNIIAKACGALAVAGVFAAVCVVDGSSHEMAVRCCGALAFAVFGLAWAALKEGQA